MANKEVDPDLQPIIADARLLSIKWRHGFINYDHLFVAMLKNSCEATMFLSHCDVAVWEEETRNVYPVDTPQKPGSSVFLTKVAERALKHAFIIARQNNQHLINSIHLLLALLSFDNNVTNAFNKAGILIEDITTAYFKKAIKKFSRIIKPIREKNYTKTELFFLSRWTKRKRLAELLSNATNLHIYRQFNDSITACRVGLSLIPGHIELKDLLAYNYFQLRDYDIALSLMLELHDADPINPQLRFSVAYILDRTGKYEEAAIMLDQMLSESPNNSAYLNNRGFNLFRQGRYRESIPFFEKAIHQNPKLAYAFNNLGFAKYKIGETAAGMALINKSLDLDRGNAFAYKHKGVIAMEQGDDAEAKKYLELAIRYGYSEKYDNEVELLLAKLKS